MASGMQTQGTATRACSEIITISSDKLEWKDLRYYLSILFPKVPQPVEAKTTDGGNYIVVLPRRLSVPEMKDLALMRRLTPMHIDDFLADKELSSYEGDDYYYS